MTKKEFIERLKNYPEDSIVLIDGKKEFIIEDSRDENNDRHLNLLSR